MRKNPLESTEFRRRGAISSKVSLVGGPLAEPAEVLDAGATTATTALEELDAALVVETLPGCTVVFGPAPSSSFLLSARRTLLTSRPILISRHVRESTRRVTKDDYSVRLFKSVKVNSIV
jgi:hypothetical protein